MNVLVKTKDMNRFQWLKWRNKGIGGSDVSVIAGKNPFRSVYELWLEKTGQLVPQEEDNEFTHFGKVLEKIVKNEFMERTGLKVRSKNAILRSDDHPFMLADLDGVINENGKMVIFEAKTGSAYKEDLWEQGVPEAYLMQVQHYMAVTGSEKSYIAALIGGNHFFCHTVYRDDDFIDKLIQMESMFWNDCVLGGREPVADGSDATTTYLSEKYPVASDETEISLPDNALQICDEYKAVSAELDELTEKKTALSNQLKSMLGSHSSGVIGDRRVSWGNVTRTALDQKRLQEENREIYDKYLKKSSYRRLLVA